LTRLRRVETNQQLDEGRLLKKKGLFVELLESAQAAKGRLQSG
jgi:hypothetical protein